MAERERRSNLLAVEYLRDSGKVSAADLASRDVQLRRMAARVLARGANEPDRPLLERALTDEDPEVVSWGAFGLGRICTAKVGEPTVRKLVTRAATLILALGPGSPRLSDSRLDPWFAFSQAIGRCGIPGSERTLRSWMTVSTELAKVAVQGLDYYVQVAKTLEASTIVALLGAAEKERNLAIALLPLSRLNSLEPLVARRLVALAPRLLETAGDGRRYLLRVLPMAGELALPILERIAIDDGHYHPLERVEAIRALAKMDASGQEALARILPRIASFDSLASDAVLLSPKWSIFYELLEEIKEVPKTARGHLEKILSLDSAGRKNPAALRRVSYLRCHAAVLLDVEEPSGPEFASCDATTDQREKKLAQVAVLNRSRIRGRRTGLFESLLTDSDPVVAMAALGLLSTHEELGDVSKWMVSALRSDSMGVVATAARQLADHRTWSRRGLHSNAVLAQALESALEKKWPVDAVEVRVALMDAAAELGYLNAKPRIVSECASVLPRIRQHAEQALRRLGEPNQKCGRPRDGEPPTELKHLVSTPSTIRFTTETGSLEIRLDPTLAPIAVTRVVDLAKAGFYDGIVVHRVVAGFVVQLGDRGSDGYGGAGRAPIPGELSPEPFGPLDVGMALSGLDSGSSQIFVTLGPYPSLGGEYTRVGRAMSGWDQLFVGDRVQKVELVQ